MGSVLHARNLQKSYRRRKVVQDVSFVVHPGEIVGLLGPNGAGKTTSFNMVAGLLPPDGGTVTLGDRDLSGLPLYRRARMGLGYLPQESTVFRGLTVEENFIAVFEAQKKSKEVCRQGARDLIARFNLEHVRDNLGSQLSGGERRRVEMARTLIPDPEVVLLDEPFAGVDPITVSEIRGFIRTMRDNGIGVLVTDHNVRETLGTCDRAYLISEGKILLAGTPQEIVDDPVARKAYLGDDFEL
ncbi:MAG: LPS export ABC transporter ATP-binding protein [Deltaproteobacteria bacterium RIFOXYA12_FULL_58_15]|nr:MAG: LPS export ABC transporter ATP-binding protein [Deltaproteobacteria bacterium RIFOXYA12_FULL_58_15]OGR08339.1 MAG: LPS export ABC transporter ATP-binding protein [Deltaproteobacteria bacterium RIFOXYB12_FULL_58_9]